MITADPTAPESRTFEADVAKLLHLMVHSVYSDKDIFLRELISNAADACEKLRYEAIADPALLGDDPKPRITLADRRREPAAHRRGQRHRHEPRRDGRGARHHRALGHQGLHGAHRGRARRAKAPQLIGQFGVGFYSAFMVADRVDVVSRRAGSDEACALVVRRQGRLHDRARRRSPRRRRAARGSILHLMDDAASYTERYTLERIVKAQSGHVPVPISLVEKPGAEPQEIADGAALWVQAESRDQARGIHRLLPQRRRPVRRAGADGPFPRRGPARIHGPGLRAGLEALRPVRSGPHGPHEALRAARLHHRRGRDPAALPALRARPRRFRRPAAQRLARDDPGKPDPRRDQEGRDEPHPGRTREARRRTTPRPTPRSGRTSARC